ncbi:MAG: serine/threonine-protein kinase [Acidobacteriota bacterium]
MAGEHVGPFEIQGALGSGGMGTVWRAVDTRLGRTVALKLLLPDLAADERARSRLTREAQAASRIDHPNIGTVYEVGEHDGQPYIAMALHEGETLTARLRRGRMTVAETEPILRQIASGLAAAHRAGVVHRDLKPGNVMLTADGAVKILDFGLAKVAGRAADSLTSTGAVMGTVAYMSPEQARGEELDARTDVWSLGVIAYEMLSGSPPFGGQTDPAILSRILIEDPPALSRRGSGVSPWLAALAARMIAKDRNARPRDGAEVVAALDARVGPVRLRPAVRIAAVGRAVACVIVGLDLARKRVRLELVPASEASLVALPCQVFGSEEARFLTDAVPATLTTALAQVKGLRVQSPPTSVQWDPGRADMELIRKSYAVTHCVRCSVTAQGQDLSIDVQTIDLGSGTLRWGHRYDGTRGAYLELVQKAADGVRAVLLPGSPPARATDFSGSRSEAELALRHGRYLALQYAYGCRADDLRDAREAFQLCLRLDPSSAAAAAGMAFVALLTEQCGVVDTPTAIGSAEPWIATALRLDPDCSGAWDMRAAISNINPSDTSWAQRFQYALRTARGAPDCALQPVDHALGGALDYASPELGIATYAEAARVDPLSPAEWGNMEVELYSLGRYDEARAALERARALAPDSPMLFQREAIYALRDGRLTEARDLMEKLRCAVVEGRHRQDTMLPYLEMLLAMDEHDDSAVARARAILGPTGNIDELVFRKRYDEAIESAVVSYASMPGLPADWEMFALNPILAPIRDDPRLAPHLEHLHELYSERLDVIVAARDRGELPSYLEAPLARILEREGRK